GACIPAEPPTQTESARSLLLAGVNVVPMDREVVLDAHDILIASGRIVAMAPAGSLDIPRTARVVELEGSYVMPGLIDLHIHVGREDELLMYLTNGVTTVLNLHGEPWHLEWGRQIEAGSRFGPRLVSCGPPLRGRELSLEAAVAAIDSIAEAGFCSICRSPTGRQGLGGEFWAFRHPGCA
ncbi:MAG: hypothetical protein ACE5GX_11295, partial [Thermoanaerobaculia bacterium]